jgi:hypothetical protein
MEGHNGRKCDIQAAIETMKKLDFRSERKDRSILLMSLVMKNLERKNLFN